MQVHTYTSTENSLEKILCQHQNLNPCLSHSRLLTRALPSLQHYVTFLWITLPYLVSSSLGSSQNYSQHYSKPERSIEKVSNCFTNAPELPGIHFCEFSFGEFYLRPFLAAPSETLWPVQKKYEMKKFTRISSPTHEKLMVQIIKFLGVWHGG